MKALQKLVGFTLMMMTLCFTTSCSNDDEPKDNPIQQVAGTYTGWAKGTFSYAPTGSYSQAETITITANEDAKTVKVVYKSESWGTTTIESATVVANGSGYQLKGSGKSLMGMGGNNKEYDSEMTGTLSADKKTYNFQFSLPAVMGGLTITVQNGDAPSAGLIAGKYEGDIEMKVGGQSQGTSTEQPISIALAEDGTATVTLPESGMGSMKLPAVELKGVKVTSDDRKTFTLSLDETEVGVEVNGKQMALKVKLNGTITNGQAKIDYSIKPGAMPFAIDYSFQSK